ncbi:SAMHD1 family protein [Megaselia abdita]
MKITDVVHGDFHLPPIVAAIVKTDIFQRLKGIHQLGSLYFVAPEAKSNRYEHCLGTYYVADQMLKHLESNWNLSIDLFYKQCVTIAGLLHDIGHGPFSHCWDFNKLRSHERNAYDCIDHIFSRDDIKISDNGEKNSLAVEIIKSLINPEDMELKTRVTGNPLFDSNYMFIYEIISNKKCELDVDKADYLLRDNHYMTDCDFFPRDPNTNEKYIVRSKDILGIFYNARISDDRQHVEFRTLDFGNIYHLFDSRTQFHIHMYQQSECNFKEILLVELVKERDQRSTLKKLSEIDSRKIEDFLELTDEVVLKELEKVNDEIDSRNKVLQMTEKLTVEEELEKVKNDEYQRMFSALNGLSYSISIEKREKSIPVHVKVKYAGEKMREDDIPFYGDITKKPKVNQMKGVYEKTWYYTFNDSNNNN